MIDTGVRRTHREFEGRADWIGDFTSGTSERPGSDDADDCDPPPSPERGHGTHVASILSGRTFGVARAVRVHALRILPCTGTTRTDFNAAVRAVDWITAHGSKPAVVNISPARFETADRSLDEAIRRSILAGFVYVLSAGGIENIDAFSPQRVADAIKVGSTDASDMARQGRYGPHLTIFAPGIRIQGAGSASDSAEFSGDGDSYAAPFVAGVAALYLQQHPQATPAEVKSAILAAATRDLVRNAGAAPNLLLHAVDVAARRERLPLIDEGHSRTGSDAAMSGFEFIDRVRRFEGRPEIRDIPAAALTAFARSEDRSRVPRSGFQLHLAKPVDPAELMAAMASLAKR